MNQTKLDRAMGMFEHNINVAMSKHDDIEMIYCKYLPNENGEGVAEMLIQLTDKPYQNDPGEKDEPMKKFKETCERILNDLDDKKIDWIIGEYYPYAEADEKMIVTYKGR